MIDISDGAAGLEGEIELSAPLLPVERIVFIADATRRCELPATFVEGNDCGLYWLNLRLGEDDDPGSWRVRAPKQRLTELLELGEQRYRDALVFRHGPRAWNSRW